MNASIGVQFSAATPLQQEEFAGSLAIDKKGQSKKFNKGKYYRLEGVMHGVLREVEACIQKKSFKSMLE